MQSKEFLKLQIEINKLNLQDTDDRESISHENPSFSSNEIQSASTPKSKSFSSEESSENSFSSNDSSQKKRKIPPKIDYDQDGSSTSKSSLEEIEATDYSAKYKIRKIRGKCESVMGKIHRVCLENNENLANIIARCCLFDRGTLPEDSKNCIQDVFWSVEKELGLEKTFQELIPDDLWKKKLEDMSVPDWQQLLVKLEVPISDDGWQKLLNRTHLGKGGVG